ncbi:hypothetical protein DAETH_47950 (plasmid) [Deinococcus aetherius]|uniref:Uncharacterized protein n=1 Tax=Deinococcus aetherius TaxID=200252 RepID=A0ABM8ALW9_9DEIO|nr:hypothetical protein [Deinococcus aetherius]BDP44826.1 hypothetical protein DAETH_47950 [Deinococcus aetherius]
MNQWWKSKVVWSAITIALISLYKMLGPSRGWPPLPDEILGLPAALGLYGLRSAIATQPAAPVRAEEQATAPVVDTPGQPTHGTPVSVPTGFRPLAALSSEAPDSLQDGDGFPPATRLQ